MLPPSKIEEPTDTVYAVRIQLLKVTTNKDGDWLDYEIEDEGVHSQ